MIKTVKCGMCVHCTILVNSPRVLLHKARLAVRKMESLERQANGVSVSNALVKNRKPGLRGVLDFLLPAYSRLLMSQCTPLNLKAYFF